VLAECVLTDDHRLDVELGDELEVVDGRKVGRIRHRDRERAPDPPERQDEMLLRDLGRDQLQDLRVDVELVEVDRGNPVLPGQHPGELLLGHEAEVDEGVSDPVAGRFGFGEPFLELRFRNESFADEEISEPDFLGDLGCHQ
jgi:hypothetical protein